MATGRDLRADDRPLPEDAELCWREFNAECYGERVDWRARCLVIQAEVDRQRERALAAEEAYDAILDAVEQLPVYLLDDGSGSEAGAVERIEYAADELRRQGCVVRWRRTGRR